MLYSSAQMRAVLQKLRRHYQAQQGLLQRLQQQTPFYTILPTRLLAQNRAQQILLEELERELDSFKQ